MSTIDYARMRRVHPKQKAALTRAMTHWRNSGKEDNSRVVKACREAVQEWDAIGCWPDDWTRWQVALSETLPWHEHMTLGDLRD